MKSTTVGGLEKGISGISLGTSLYGALAEGSAAEADFIEAIRFAVENGVVSMDTARGYLGGRCESFLGGVLSGLKLSEKVVVATKLQYMGYDETITEVEKSRTALRTDCIDIMYIHWPKGNNDLRPMMRALEHCRKEKRIALIGVSNFSVAQLESVSGAGKVDIVQMGYNLLWRIHEKELIPYCAQKGITITTYSSLAQGILTGKFDRKPQFGPEDNRNRSIFFEDAYWPSVQKAVEEMKALAESRGCSLTDLALHWLLSKKEIASVVVGARNKDQLGAILESEKKDVSSAMDELTAISDRLVAKLPAQGNIFQYYP
jgi:aryl-alcohol dehydrogenase-like predicted oxidoreductase